MMALRHPALAGAEPIEQIIAGLVSVLRGQLPAAGTFPKMEDGVDQVLTLELLATEGSKLHMIGEAISDFLQGGCVKDLPLRIVKGALVTQELPSAKLQKSSRPVSSREGTGTDSSYNSTHWRESEPIVRL